MKKNIAKTVIFLMLFSISFCTVANAEEKVHEWKFCVGLAYAKGYDFIKTYVETLENEMDGRIKFTAFQPGEHPFSVPDVIKAVRDNIMQMGFSLNIYTQSIFPQMGLQDLPFLFSSPDEFNAIMEDQEYQDIYRFILADPLAKWKQTPVAWFPMPGYMFAGPKFVDNFNSLDGLRIRIYSEQMAEMIKLFGATPVNITWDEVYTALHRKMADGFLTATSPAYSAKLYEISEYVTITDFSVGLHFISVNDQALNELPEDLRKKFLDSCKKLNPYLVKACKDKYVADMQKAMFENGTRFTAMSPKLREETRDKMAPVYQKWAKRTGGDSEKIINRIDEFHKNYLKNN